MVAVRTRAHAGVFVVLVCACEAHTSGPAWLESDYAEIRLTDGAKFCRGNVELDVDAHVESTASFLDVDAPAFELEMYERPPVPGCVFTGCFDPPDFVRATRTAVRHEIVHVVSHPLDVGSDFLREGIAEALAGGRTEVVGDSDIFEHADLPASELSYSLAGHFVRWLIEEHGRDSVVALLAGADYSDAVGEERDAVFEAFEASAPWSYPGFDSCTAPELPLPQIGEALEFEVDGSCEAEGVRAHGLGNYVRHTLRVPALVELEIEPGSSVGLRVVACQTEILVDEPGTDIAGDIRMEWKWGLHNGTIFKPGTTASARFPPGAYEIRVEFPADDAGEFLLTRIE